MYLLQNGHYKIMDIKKQALINTIGCTFYLASLWLFTVLTAQFLDYEAVGRLTIAMTIGNIVVLIQLYGVRSFQGSDAIFYYSPAIYLWTRVVTVLSGIVLGFGIAFFLGYSSDLIVTIMLFVFFKSSEAFSDVLYGDVQRCGKLEFAGYSTCLHGVFSGLLFFIGVCFYHNLNAALFFVAVSGLLITFLIDFPLYEKIVKKNVKCVVFEKTAVFNLLKECFPLLITVLLPVIIIAFPRVVLERYYGTELLGFYGNLSAPSLILSTLIPNVLIAFLPSYGRLSYLKDYRRIFTIWLKSIIGTTIFSVSFILCFFLYGRQLMCFFYTEQILQYFHFLYPIFISMMLYAFTTCNSIVLIALRKNRFLAVTVFLSCFICIGTSIPLIKNYGISGAIAVLILSYGLQAIVQAVLIMHQCQWRRL